MAVRAAELRPTDDRNLALLAWIAGSVGDDRVRHRTLVDLLRREPWIAASARWSAHFPTGAELHDLLVAADADWEAARETEPRFDLPQAWLAAAVDSANREFDRASTRVVIDVIRCQLTDARSFVSEAPPRPTQEDLLAIVMGARATGLSAQADRAIQLASLRGLSLATLAEGQLPRTSTFWDPAEDRRQYRRAVPSPADLGLALPTAAEGLSAWLMDPRDAATIGAPNSGLAQCGLGSANPSIPADVP